jgi:capsular exopolysaccharide synthesis family protein
MNDYTVSAPPARSISSLRFYLGVIRRRAFVIVVIIVVAIAAAIAYTAHKSTIYSANAQVEINREDLADTLTGTADATSSASDFAAVVQTQADVARSPSVAKRVVRAVPQAHLTYSEFLDNSSVSATSNADLLTFTVKNGNPSLVIRLTNAYARAFVQYRTILDTASLNLAARQLTHRLAQLRATGAGKSPLATQLTAKQQQLQELETLQSSNASVTAAAVTSSKVSPKPTEYIALGVIAGIVLAAIAAAALEALDTKIRSDDELETRLGLTLIGYIPPPPRRVRKSLLMMKDPAAREGEGFRFLALNLQGLMADHDLRSLMVSSAVDGEGKSTTIANLAVTLARSGTNVALVDLDLRRPALHTLFELGPGAGITDVARGRVDLETALQRVELEHAGSPEENGSARPPGRLSVLRCGLLPPNPGEFVEDPAVEGVIAELCADNAVVLIDSPPVLVTSDALSLSRLTDAMFIVARVPTIRRGMTDQLRRVLSGARSPILGVVRTGRRGSTTFPNGTRAYGQGPGWRSRDRSVPQLHSGPPPAATSSSARDN